MITNRNGAVWELVKKEDFIKVLDNIVCTDGYGRVTDRMLTYTFDISDFQKMVPDKSLEEVYQIFLDMHKLCFIDLDECKYNGYPMTFILRPEGIQFYRSRVIKDLIK